MGISARKGNGGLIGYDARSNVTSSLATTSSIGILSNRKIRLERLGGDLQPIFPTDFLFEDTFATGDLSKWTNLEESTSKRWICGQNTKGNDGAIKTIPSSSTHAAYISDDSTDNHYTSNTECHMYFDFDIPSGATSLTLTFEWMCYGENGIGNSNYDFGYIMFADPSTFTPSAGTGYGLSGTGYERIIGTNVAANTNNGKFNSEDASSRAGSSAARNAFYGESITIDGSEITTGTLWQTGVTRRLVFSFESDSSLTFQPSWTIANVRLKANS
tara:strand:+ start:714 stop:1532 length:819 start_codon:yes stop_codon:yes gene_type:complete